MMIASDVIRCPLPMPWGWFQVLYSDELRVGESKPLHYFGKELVIFRTESGKAVVLDAYCPHMGAHLGYGIRDQAGGGSRVVGESIECPFHGWQYNAEGQCTHIPYAKNMPPKIARGEQVIACWPVREVNQTILVWYHPDKLEPLFEPPVIPEAGADNADWSEFTIFRWEVNVHMQEMAENAVDPAHFQFVHGTNDVPDAEVLEFDGYTRRGFLKTRNPTPKGVVEGSIENQNFGPGLSVVRFTGIYDTVLMANVTPIESELTRAQYAFIQPKATLETLGKTVGKAIIGNIAQQMEEDIIIWNRKAYYEKPLLCDGDGPFAKLRRWYGQFLQSEANP